MRQIAATAIEELCAAFSRGGYNPTPIIDLGVLVASADGKMTESERAMLREVFQALLETTLSPDVVDHLIVACHDVIEVAGVERRARLIGEILLDCDAVEPGLTVALAIAFGSEGLSAPERSVIERIANTCKVSPTRFAELIERVRAHADDDPKSVRFSLARQQARS